MFGIIYHFVFLLLPGKVDRKIEESINFDSFFFSTWNEKLYFRSKKTIFLKREKLKEFLILHPFTYTTEFLDNEMHNVQIFTE